MKASIQARHEVGHGRIVGRSRQRAFIEVSDHGVVPLHEEQSDALERRDLARRRHREVDRYHRNRPLRKIADPRHVVARWPNHTGLPDGPPIRPIRTADHSSIAAARSPRPLPTVPLQRRESRVFRSRLHLSSVTPLQVMCHRERLECRVRHRGMPQNGYAPLVGRYTVGLTRSSSLRVVQRGLGGVLPRSDLRRTNLVRDLGRHRGSL